MDIKELEFLRDFCDDLGNLKEDMRSIVLAMDSEVTETDEVPENFSHWLWSIYHQLLAVEKVLEQFKEKVDYKYYDTWKAKYPHMLDRDATDEEIEEKVKEGMREAGYSNNKDYESK